MATKKECPNCHSTHVVRFGYIVTRSKGKRQRLKCQECGSVFYGE